MSAFSCCGGRGTGRKNLYISGFWNPFLRFGRICGGIADRRDRLYRRSVPGRIVSFFERIFPAGRGGGVKNHNNGKRAWTGNEEILQFFFEGTELADGGDVETMVHPGEISEKWKWDKSGKKYGIIFRKKSYHAKSISHLISGKNTGRGDEYE